MHTNSLIHEASPYLRQHAHNPVDWLPWGDAAFERARREDRPVFLSVGYAACHWCHVMERESFENDEIARLLNENFVSIKVDREERPDVDHHYMQAVQRLTGHGGWPMSVFLTPDRKPFFGGTYWPPESRYGRPGFRDVLDSVSRAWRERREEILRSSDDIHDVVSAAWRDEAQAGDVGRELLTAAVRASERAFDAVYGGFGGAPKFPHAMELSLLTRLSARLANPRALEMVLVTLRRMARGGIYDQLGGGFHRYSTDARWLVPHFEKMLYDNALLVPVYLDAYLLTDDPEFLRVARATLDWALREMSVPEGGFASSLDADSEGEEGRYYVWTPGEVTDVLGEVPGNRFGLVYDVTDHGNFDNGHSILNLIHPIDAAADRIGISAWDLEHELAEDRRKLLMARAQRTRPARDDKVLTDWNSLMIGALVRGFEVIGDEEFLATAQRSADRLLRPYEESGELVHSFLGERVLSNQLLLDYAALGGALLDLFGADGDQRWFAGAESLARRMDELFASADGPYVMSEVRIAGAAPVDPYDSAMPSGNSLAGNLLVRLFQLTGDKWYEKRARKQVEPLAGLMRRAPGAFAQAMVTVDLLVFPPAHLVLIGDRERVLWRAARSVYVPGLHVLWRPHDRVENAALSALLEGKTSVDGKPTAYLCRDFACRAPITGAAELRENLASIAAVAAESASA